MASKSSTTDIKNHNRNLIYQYVLHGEHLSQKEIANELQLSLPTVIQNLNELKLQNLILEKGHYQSTGGRKAKKFIPNTMAKVAIGLDITQNHIALALTNLIGEVIDSCRIRCVYHDTPAFYSKVLRYIDDMLFKNSIDTKTILGMGVSIPAIVSLDHKTISSSMLIKGLPEGTIFYEHLKSYFKYPIYIENDASSSGFAEFWLSPATSNIFYLFLSNSVGGAIYFNNEPYTGENSHSAEIGHTTLVPNGKKCYCGRIGCVDCYCSAISLSSLSNGSLDDFFKKLQYGDPVFQNKWNEYLNYLAATVINIHMLFDCDIMIGGYVGMFIEPYIEELKQRVAKEDVFFNDVSYIKPCKLHSESSALGVALTFIDQFRKSI